MCIITNNKLFKMASFTEIDKTQIAEPVRAICNEKSDSVDLQQTEEQETEEQETEEHELEHVNKMKQKYGETDWMWYVKDTEDDCRIAEMHRQWEINRGVSPDFNIHDTRHSINCRCQYCKEDFLREIEAAEAWENSEEKKMEDENRYVISMLKKYGDNWQCAVIDTEDE